MLIPIYILFIAVGFLFMIFGIINGSYWNSLSKKEENPIMVTVSFLILSAIILSITSFHSLYIESVDTATIYSYIELSGFFGFMALFDIILLIIYVFKGITE